jgi:hypothetical protein
LNGAAFVPRAHHGMRRSYWITVAMPGWVTRTVTRRVEPSVATTSETWCEVDLIEHDGDDLRDLTLIERKRRLARLIGKAKRRSIQYSEHLTGDGATVFEHVCRIGWRASCRSGWTHPIAAARRGRGSR